jgi:uncharacterized Zn finger protein
MLEIIPTEASAVKRIACPQCGEKLPRVGLKRDSHIEGLTFRCGKCGTMLEVKSK